MKHENTRQRLVELIADFLDSTEVIVQESFDKIKDPEPRELTELHERMADAAMEEYENTVVNY